MVNYNPKKEFLKPNSVRTPLERSELAKRAGMKSGEIRREKRKMREILEILLLQDIMQAGALKSTKEAMMCSIVKKAVNGDLKAVEWIQACIEEKPAEKLSLSPSPEVKTEVQMIIDEIIGNV